VSRRLQRKDPAGKRHVNGASQRVKSDRYSKGEKKRTGRRKPTNGVHIKSKNLVAHVVHSKRSNGNQITAMRTERGKAPSIGKKAQTGQEGTKKN